MTGGRPVRTVDHMDVITVDGLEKRYGKRVVIDGLDLSVGREEIVAILGPNGAGKTTLLEVLEGHRRRDGGNVDVLGGDPGTAPPAWRARIGIVLQDQGIIEGLSAAEVLDLYGGYYPRRRPTDELLRLVGLADRADDRVERLSGGARRRLDVAVGLVGDPELLFLDEPTTGFDPDARRRVWQVIRQLRASGVTIVLTTHYLDEAEDMADRIGVIHHGKIILVEDKVTLMRKLGKKHLTLHIAPELAQLPPVLAARGMTLGAGGNQLCYVYDPRSSQDDVPALLEDLRREGIVLKDLETTQSSLEDIFVNLVREEA